MYMKTLKQYISRLGLHNRVDNVPSLSIHMNHKNNMQYLNEVLSTKAKWSVHGTAVICKYRTLSIFAFFLIFEKINF